EHLQIVTMCFAAALRRIEFFPVLEIGDEHARNSERKPVRTHEDNAAHLAMITLRQRPGDIGPEGKAHEVVPLSCQQLLHTGADTVRDGSQRVWGWEIVRIAVAGHIGGKY